MDEAITIADYEEGEGAIFRKIVKDDVHRTAK